MSLPIDRSRSSVPPELNRKYPAVQRNRTRLFSETQVGTTKIGLNAASESMYGQLPGIFHQHQIKSDYGVKNFVMRMPARCPCCGKDTQLYCPKCVWNTFFAHQNFGRKRDELNRKKAELGNRLKRLMEQEADDQSQLFQKKKRIIELKTLISQKRDNIVKLADMHERKQKDVEKIKMNVDKLREKANIHSKRIKENCAVEERMKNDLEKLKLKRHTLLVKQFKELAHLFPIVESAPQRHEGESETKIIQLIEDAAFSSDKKQYSEVAKKKAVPKVYFKVRQCFVPGTSDYTELLAEIRDDRSLTSRANKETVAGLAFMAQFISAASYLFDVYIPFRNHVDDLLQCENWTLQLFQTDVFSLNLSIVVFCMHVGIDSRSLDLHRPFANLNILKERLVGRAMSPCFFDRKHDRLHEQIVASLGSLSWEDSQETGFDTDEIDEDWINVINTRP